MGRNQLLGVGPVTPLAGARAGPPARRPAPFSLRLFTLLAILWSLYAGFVALDLSREAVVSESALATAGNMAVLTAVAAAVALFVLGRLLLVRRSRRGAGLAAWSLFALSVATAALFGACSRAHSGHALSRLPGLFGEAGPSGRAARSLVPLSPLPWESRR
jgi:hypothetical protein